LTWHHFFSEFLTYCELYTLALRLSGIPHPGGHPSSLGIGDVGRFAGGIGDVGRFVRLFTFLFQAGIIGA